MKQGEKVKVWEERITLPTYEIGEADKNPMFLEKRVYQGSSGKVYPFPVIDKIYDRKVDKAYTAVYLENEYLKVMILPELGGRIQRAYDKTNGYDFVYYNEVIKPALVGLTGPWISGGIEFNWPQHHRPTTFLPVEYLLTENPDGSRTVSVSEVDRMYGTKGMASFTLYPGKSFIEIKGQLYNRTCLPQTFLWWANPAVAVNDDTQSIFPPDVHAVMDHGKRDVSRFPIATGVYYKHDYGAGVDISRYKNIPVPTSYMAYHSDYNFVGGYDHGKEAGILHIADHHVSPGKKQWTWGSGDFGKAWDRNLTDRNGPYIELMTGMFTDNQPDFTWLKPFEEKTFTQYFMPYKKAANVKNASTEAVLNLETEMGKARVVVYATSVYDDARIVLCDGQKTYLDRKTRISPVDIADECVTVDEGSETSLTLSVYDSKGRLMLSYSTKPEEIEEIPSPVLPAEEPEDIRTVEELYLTARHIEQYRHATYEPDAYYLEGLKRDPEDIRINTAYGLLLLRRGCFAESEVYFRTAIRRLTWKNPNPYDSEAYYNLGLSLWYQGREDAAFDAFYKAAWTAAQQEMSFYYLALIAARKGNIGEALSHADRSLVKNSRNLKARALYAMLLRKLRKDGKAVEFLKANLETDPFDYVSRFEWSFFDPSQKDLFLKLAGGKESVFIEAASDYAEAGFYKEAVQILRLSPVKGPMIRYYEAYYSDKLGNRSAVSEALAAASSASSAYCFPNRLEDIAVLRFAISFSAADSKAPYYLGNLFYDKKQYGQALEMWQKSVKLDSSFPTVWRNLSLAWFNKKQDPEKARDAMEKAFALDTTDARVFLEYDQLLKKLGSKPAERLALFERHADLYEKRDDLYTEYVTLLNLLGRCEDAYRKIEAHRFHPWEGGEGKITGQYTIALSEMARAELKSGKASAAKALLEKALVFPENLGEGKLEGQKDNNIYYYLGLAEEVLGSKAAAHEAFLRASVGTEEPAGGMYYNDQPADMILYQGLANLKLGRDTEARSRFHKLVDYGERHIFDTIRIDYFAVSLPDLQLFDDNLTIRNKAHCHYLIGLGSLGLGDLRRAEQSFGETLVIDSAHMGAILHLRLLNAE